MLVIPSPWIQTMIVPLGRATGHYRGAPGGSDRRWTLGGSAHAPHVRDPVKVNLLLHDFNRWSRL